MFLPIEGIMVNKIFKKNSKIYQSQRNFNFLKLKKFLELASSYSLKTLRKFSTNFISERLLQLIKFLVQIIYDLRELKWTVKSFGAEMFTRNTKMKMSSEEYSIFSPHKKKKKNVSEKLGFSSVDCVVRHDVLCY